jgi:cytochrome b6-f complex subunit 7
LPLTVKVINNTHFHSSTLLFSNILGDHTMSAESMLVNGAFLLIGLTLVGLAWGFVIIKLQGGEE